MPDPLERLTTALADRYTIEREIGSGGMATVYLAEDLRHHRKVAIKVLRPDLAATLGPERFLREIEVAAQLQHPHILPLHDSGEADGFLYYVMPYIEGQSLRDKLAKEGELTIGDAVRILRDVVDALTEAHAHGVVHRDIKPENILLRGRHALVTDFGVAKAVSEATGREKLTTAGVALGTPAYMAPEQASADPHLDHRVDIYAVGAVAYELLTGRPVFMGTTPQMILSAHVTEAPQPVTKHRDTVPPALEAVVMRCLGKKPADRFQTAEELLPQLEALATPSGGVTPTDTRPLAATPTKKRWLVPTVLASAAALIVAGFLGALLLKSDPITITTSNIRAVTSDPSLEFHPALSPDGSRVAFLARRGGKWSVVIRSTRTTAGAREILPTPGQYDSQAFPRWSADGEFVRFRACVGDQCAWREVAWLGGSVRTLEAPTVSTTSWSPDGSRVAFTTLSDSILTYSISDGTTTPLAVQESRTGLHSFVWSPNGRRIAYVVGNSHWRTSFYIEMSAIWIVDADGGEPVRLTGNDFMDVSPAWLDDDHLLFISDREGLREVYVAEVGPTGPRGEPQRVPGATHAHSISYSIEGRKLAFSQATARQNIWSYPIGTGPVSIREGFPVTSENAVIESHDISPDGEWIAYCSNLRGNLDIYKKPLDGGIPTPITDSPFDEFVPRWSPDGTEILFSRHVGDSVMVMVVPAEGGISYEVTSGERGAWSPSGLEIAFASSRTGQSEVWAVSRDSLGGTWSETVQLTDFGCFHSDWAPDGSGVLAACRAGEEIVLVSLEGEILWRYDLTSAGLLGFRRTRYSLDGSTIYGSGSHEDGSSGIWAIPPGGGEPNLIIAFDDAEISSPWGAMISVLSVGPDHLYLTVGEYESDIWVMDLEW